MIFSSSMEDFYKSQIEYISKINQEKQEELDLEQRKLDMNRSMLSLNRQIAALERDTSYGAQARLEDLRLTRAREASERESFVMDMVANQMIEGLQTQLQEDIRNSSAATAENTARLVELYGGKPADFTTIERVTGTTVGGGASGRTGYMLESN